MRLAVTTRGTPLLLAALVSASLLAACAGGASGVPRDPADRAGSAGTRANTPDADPGATAGKAGTTGPAAVSGRGRSAGQSVQPDSPARLATNAPLACLESIEAVAEQASGNRVMLGPAAFASSDELVLIRGIVRGPDGAPLDGRMPPPDPVVLKLSMNTSGCAVRQVPAEGGLPGGARAVGNTRVPVSVVDPVPLPACQCLRLPD